MLGIDQEIQRKVDAYRSNPQALQQRYAQNQELIDLLALQKLKSEKDAMARQMQMQMQQAPQTIKAQREQELLQRNKQELMQQTAGVMQNAQQRQAQNMQRVAREGAVTPAGLGALAAPQRMAQGGIVESLKDVDIDDLASLEQQLAETTDPQVKTYLRRRIMSLRAAQGMSRVPPPQGEVPPPQGEVPPPQGEVPPPQGEVPPGLSGLPAPAAAPTSAVAPAGIPTVTAQPVDAAAAMQEGQAGIESIVKPLRKPPEPVAFSEKAASGMQERYKSMRDRLASLEQRYGDPKEEQRRKLAAFLRGAAGGVTIGQTFAGASASLAEEEDKLLKERMERESVGREIETAEIGTQFDMEKSTMTAALQAQQIDAANKQAVTNAMQTAGAQAIEVAVANARNALEADKANITARVAEMQTAAQEVENTLKAQELDANARVRAEEKAQTLYVQVTKEIAQMHKDAIAAALNTPGSQLHRAIVALEKAQQDEDAEAEARAKAQVTAAEELVRAGVTYVANEAKLIQLQTRLGSLAGLDAAPSANVDDLLKKYGGGQQ
jgi:hypothetical protein